MKTPLKNLALVGASLAVSFVGAETVARIVDHQSLFAMPLAAGTENIEAPVPAQVALAAGVSRAWFRESPPPLPNRGAPPAEWTREVNEYRTQPVIETSAGVLLAADIFKAWNATYAGDTCQHELLRHMPSHRLFLYSSPDNTPRPRYRYLPNATTPQGLVTDEIGWRGPPIRPRTAKTVRIVFVGASTTAESHDIPYSYPELIDHWLQLWAQSKHLDIDFQALNAAREGMTSTDIAEIVRSEVAPMRPDLVVYYEGANQFDLRSLTEGLGNAAKARATLPIEHDNWLSQFARYSSIGQRVQAAVASVTGRGDGREFDKPDYTFEWPKDVNEFDPDLLYPELPVDLSTILDDFDDMRATLDGVGSEFAVSSFFWLVRDGMVVDPLRGKYILNMLNRTYWPWHYRDMERLAAFQNRVFRKYAVAHGLPFIDVARDMPFDPGLFTDAIHTTTGGVRVRAWVFFQQLVPIIEERLKRGAWPTGKTEEHWPIFTPRVVNLDCGA